MAEMISPSLSYGAEHITARELRGLFGLTSQSDQVVANAAKKLNEERLKGSKLNAICSEFGPGSLFFLGAQLSDELWGSFESPPTALFC